MIKSKEWWRNNSDEWLKKMDYWVKADKGNSKHFKDEEDFLVDEISKLPDGIRILEVGAGNGRIIGRLSKLDKDFNCFSLDINKELSDYINEKYDVLADVAEITEIPYKDKLFDLVYTHEVLQHIDPSEIDQACNELKRVGKEVWCMENWRDTPDGEKVSDSHSGRWNYDLKKRFIAYEDFYTDWGQIFIKAKE